MKKKLCVFTLYADKGASSQYRAYIFRKELEADYSVKWFDFWDNKYITEYMPNKKKHIVGIVLKYIPAVIKRIFQLTFIAPKADMIFMQKGSIPKVYNHFLNRAKSKGVRIVYDLDDAVFLYSRNNSDDIAKIADHVICGNEMLKDHYRQFNDSISVLPTVEDTRKYVPNWSDTFDKKVIGWIGSNFTADNLKMITEPLNNVISRHPEVTFDIISNDDCGYCGRIKNSRLIPWSKETYIRDLANISIGIMPLYDTDFNRGKCGFKLIQYLNMKKPVIGSGVGVNEDIIGDNGFVPKNEAEWEEAFEKLLFDREAYDKCVSNIESKFFNEYHYLKIYGRLKSILEGDIQAAR